ncbi:MAG: hypothetical protein V3T09_08565 [bacterium]
MAGNDHSSYLLKFNVGNTGNYTVIRLTTAPINSHYDGETYVAGGNFLSFDSISETIDLSTSEIKVSLSGVKLEVLKMFSDNAGQIVNRELYIYRGITNKNWELTNPPILIFQGQITSASASMDYISGQGSSVISLGVTNKLAFFGRSKLSRTNVTEHQVLYAGDKGFEYVISLSQRKDLKWSP